MELNSNFDKPAIVHAASLDWVPSPTAGVDRRMLDRIGGEVARATSIVRYAPASSFPAHTHGGGEEFYVLEGVFEDEQGAYPPGSYVRNPPQSRHSPGASVGCIIFVKLWQFDPGDRTRVCVDAASMDPEPAAGRPGVAIKPLYEDPSEYVRIEYWDPGQTVMLDDHGGLELLVLEGGCRTMGEDFVYQSWLRLPPAEPLEAESGPGGCVAWIKTGHLKARKQSNDRLA